MKRIYINEAACIGCHLCEVYCKLQHSHLKDTVKAFKKGNNPLPALWVEENKPVCFAIQCRQCTDPACVYACLTGALSRNPESGVVTVDTEKCIGCWTCVLACPFGTIAQDTGRKKAIKCDLCAGKDVPECVANCPNEALTYTEPQEENISSN